MKKKVLNLSLAIVFFILCIVTSVFSGFYLESSSSIKMVKQFIDNECQERVQGNSIFQEMDFPYSEENISEIIDFETEFSEVGNNRLSIGIKNLSFTYNGISETGYLYETKHINYSFNDYHIFSSYDWAQLSEKENSIFIPENLASSFQISVSNNPKIELTANGITQEVEVVGIYQNVVSNYITGFASRGKLINSIYNNCFFASRDLLCKFKPNYAIAMYSSDSSNNGKKAMLLQNFSKDHDFSLKWDFAEKNPEKSLMYKEILNNRTKNKNIFIGTILIIQTIVNFLIFSIFEDAFSKLLSNAKQLTLYKYILLLCIFSIPIIFILSFRKIQIKNLNALSVKLINGTSVFLIVLVIILFLLYFAYKYKEILKKIFNKNADFELDEIVIQPNQDNSLFIGNFYTNKLIEKIGIENLSFGNSNYEHLFIDLLSKINKKVYAISYPDMIANRKIKIKNCSEEIDNVKYIIPTYRNSKYNRIFEHDEKLIYEIIKLKEEGIQFKNIYLSTYHQVGLIPLIKNIYPESKVALLLPDLPTIDIENCSFFYKTRLKIINKKLFKNLKYLDLLLPITEQEREYLEFPKEKTIIYESYFRANTNSSYNKSNYFLYAGSIKEEYGLFNLIDEFIVSKTSQKFDLFICGNGPDKNKLINKIKEYPNIKYLGNKTKEETIQLEQEATALIIPDATPRPYSFHSKFLEYLASGTPVISYKPLGAKNEYLKYLNCIETNISKELDKCAEEYNEYLKKAKDARSFILKEKNEEYFIKLIKDYFK